MLKKTIAFLLSVIGTIGSFWLLPSWVYNQFVLGFPRSIDFWNLRFNEIYEFKIGPIEWTDFGNTVYYGYNFGHTLAIGIFLVISVLLGLIVLSAADSFLRADLAEDLSGADMALGRQGEPGSRFLVAKYVITLFLTLFVILKGWIATGIAIMTAIFAIWSFPMLIHNAFGVGKVMPISPVDFWAKTLVYIVFSLAAVLLVWLVTYSLLGGSVQKYMDAEQAWKDSVNKAKVHIPPMHQWDPTLGKVSIALSKSS